MASTLAFERPLSQATQLATQKRDSAIRHFPETIIKKYLLNQMLAIDRAHRYARIQQSLNRYTRVQLTYTLKGYPDWSMQLAVKSSAQAIQRLRAEAEIQRVTNVQQNALRMLTDQSWPTQGNHLPPELQDQIYIKLVECITDPFQDGFVTIEKATDVFQMVHNLVDSRRYPTVAERLVRKMLDTVTFTPRPQLLQLQDVAGLWIPSTGAVISWPTTEFPATLPSGFQAVNICHLDIWIPIYDNQNINSNWGGIADISADILLIVPVGLYLWLDNMGSLIPYHFPHLKTVSLTIDETSLERFSLLCRKRSNVYARSNYITDIALLLDIFSHLPTPTKRYRFKVVLDSPMTYTQQLRTYFGARREILCHDDDVWQLVQPNEDFKRDLQGRCMALEIKLQRAAAEEEAAKARLEEEEKHNAEGGGGLAAEAVSHTVRAD